MSAEALKLRKAIKDANIVFEGPALPIAWPETYADFFRKIYNSQDTRYLDYMRLSTAANGAVKELKLRVDALVAVTSRCRRELVGEREWREPVEKLLLHRFEVKLNCSDCGYRLWKAEISQYHGEEDEPRARHRNRPLCTCAPERNLIDPLDSGTEHIFRNKIEKLVAFFEEDKGKDHDRRPDKTIGLNPTSSLQRLMADHPDIRHGPFNDLDQLVYPFLVVEAKSAFAAEGIEHAEAQTAFPIKTFLKIQTQLQNLSEVPIHPLVWFLAYDGDQAHIYGCITEESKYRVFDLWQGSMRSYDKAIQLFYILDLICEWAATKYRRSILSCLAGGRDKRRLYTPTITTLSVYDTASSQAGPENVTCSDEVVKLNMGSDYLSERGQQYPIVLDQSSDRLGTVEFSEDSMLPGQTEHFVSNDGINQKAVVSHADNVRLVFRRVQVPADETVLRNWLQAEFMHQGSRQACIRMRRMISDPHCISSSLGGINVLQNYWLGKTELDDSINQEQPCCFFLKYATFVDVDSWQVVRRLDCVVFTQEVLQMLSQSLQANLSLPPAHNCYCLRDLATTFLACERKHAVNAALGSVHCHAVRPTSSSDVRHLSWSIAQTDSSGSFSHNWVPIQSIGQHLQAHHISKQSVERTVSSGRILPKHLQRYICAPAGFASTGQVILKSGLSSGVRANEVCMLVFTDSIYDYNTFRRGLAHSIRDSINHGDLFYLPPAGDHPVFERYDADDKELESIVAFLKVLENWMDTLNEETMDHNSQ